MRLLLISALILFLTACQTLPDSKISVDREPAAAIMKEEWKTLNSSDPESYLGKAQIQVKENQRKDGLLFQCQALSLLKEGQALNRDLLFIRLESWSPEQLSREYSNSLGEKTLRCLMSSLMGF